jgi:hypothetical protein
MVFFAHIGITLGAAVLLCNAPSWSYSRRKLPQPCEATGTTSFSQPDCAIDGADNNLSWFNSLARQMDYRLIIVGAILPDIIDKPIGMLLFRNFFSNGRIFCHTLLFLVILTAAAVYLYRKKGKPGLLRYLLVLSSISSLTECGLLPEPSSGPLTAGLLKEPTSATGCKIYSMSCILNLLYISLRSLGLLYS